MATKKVLPRTQAKSLTEGMKQRIAAATVRLPELGGQGVLIPGGFILTAAHCIEWTETGAMVLGDYFFHKVETSDGKEFRGAVCAVEPVADIAVITEPDGQVLYDDSEQCNIRTS